MNTRFYVRNEKWFEKLVLSKLFWILSSLTLFAYPVYRSLNRTLPPELPVLSKLPEYVLKNEFGKPFGSSDLKGRVYLANFMFTNCPTICPSLMKTMQVVQKRVKGVGTKVALVTFTVDPEVDTPEVLYKASRKLEANPRVWTFLTGPLDQIEKLLVQDFKVPLGKKEEVAKDVFDVAHSGRLVLVDSDGQIRGYYGTEKSDIDQLMLDLGLLINREKRKG